MPANLLGDALLFCDGLDVVAHHFAQPKRLPAALPAGPGCIRREDVVLRSVVLRGSIPGEQVLCYKRINRNRPRDKPNTRNCAG
jgi:hypothetical protein